MTEGWLPPRVSFDMPMLSDLQPDWESRPEYRTHVPGLSVSKFLQINDLLLERPNLNSSYLFRADILFDSSAQLKTVSEKSRLHAAGSDHATLLTPAVDLPRNPEQSTGQSEMLALGAHRPQITAQVQDHWPDPPSIPTFVLERTIVRELIPRNPQLDQPMRQSCFVYACADGASRSPFWVLVLYVPHASSKEGLPWYHPKVKALAYEFSVNKDGGLLAVSYLPLPNLDQTASERRSRTLLSLLQTFVRLSKHDNPAVSKKSGLVVSTSAQPLHAAALRDTILPQHIVQNTYARLKQQYAGKLIDEWVEKTDPMKHVFEDLGIAAFLIELWKSMYHKDAFPGFADIACGNGVLVYVLRQEGYNGYGFDARKRKTWEILGIDEYLKIMLCVPKPFLDVLAPEEIDVAIGNLEIHNGVFDTGTFIISNHADELTLWTPILAHVSDPSNHLPFLAIPCCSHALDGSRRRYTLRDIHAGAAPYSDPELKKEEQEEVEEVEQSTSGDLRALRMQKAKAVSHGDEKSAYACLTKKTAALAEELGIDVELTLMRIPSTRNIGVVGNRNRRAAGDEVERARQVSRLLERECRNAHGVRASALMWIERAHKLTGSSGRGKVNLGSKNPPSATGSDKVRAFVGSS